MEVLSAIVEKRLFGGDALSMVAIDGAYAKLANLSEERARRVVELIDDLAELDSRCRACRPRCANRQPARDLSLTH